MTFQCYIPRSSQRTPIGAIFVTAEGVRRMVPDHWLAQAELSAHGRLLRLVYTCCTIEVAGQLLEVLFEDAIVGRLGIICEGPSTPVPRQQLWVSSLMAIAPAEAVPAFERE
jgi:hypothetical protein